MRAAKLRIKKHAVTAGLWDPDPASPLSRGSVLAIHCLWCHGLSRPSDVHHRAGPTGMRRGRPQDPAVLASSGAFVSSPLSPGQPEKRESFLSLIPRGLKSENPVTGQRRTSDR